MASQLNDINVDALLYIFFKQEAGQRLAAGRSACCSLSSSTSPMIIQRSRSPVRSVLPSNSGAAAAAKLYGVPLRYWLIVGLHFIFL